MKKQNIAVFLSSLMLLATLAPALVAAQGTPQEGEIILGGTTDLFFEGYNPETGLTTPITLNFDPLDTSSSDQTSIITEAYDGWGSERFIGVVDLEEGNVWEITVYSDGEFTDTTEPTKTFTADELGVVGSRGLGATPTINCETALCAVLFASQTTGDIINQIYYNAASGYTWVAGHVTSPVNVASTFDFVLGAYNDITVELTQPTLLWNAVDNGEQGYFGTGVAYRVGVPGGTSAGTYSTTITYTMLTS